MPVYNKNDAVSDVEDETKLKLALAPNQALMSDAYIYFDSGTLESDTKNRSLFAKSPGIKRANSDTLLLLIFYETSHHKYKMKYIFNSNFS